MLIENYISEIKNLKVSIQAPNLPKIEYQVPVEVQNRLAFLASENERLNRQVVEMQSRGQRVETKVEYKVPADIELRINALTQENNRLNGLVIQLQNRPAQQLPSSSLITVDTTLVEQ